VLSYSSSSGRCSGLNAGILPGRYESVTFSSEDIPDLQAKEDLDFGHGVGLFPELQMDDELDRRGETVRGDYVGFKPWGKWKTLMSLKTLAV